MKIGQLYTNPLALYEEMLLGPLSQIYDARKQTELKDWQQYSNLLIDKYAIHSSSFFHLSVGIIEKLDASNEPKKSYYDLFTVHTTIRVIIETYIAFNHIFVEPETEEEQYLRFLLWKLDGLYQETKYEVKETDFEKAAEVLQDRQTAIKATISNIQSAEFFNTIPPHFQAKLLNTEKRRANWRFLYMEGKVKVLQIIDLVEHCCKQRAFFNTYRHSSIHTHSNFPAIEIFKKYRGKQLSTEYTDPITRLAIYLTCLFIYDICELDENAKTAFKKLDADYKEFISGMAESMRK